MEIHLYLLFFIYLIYMFLSFLYFFKDTFNMVYIISLLNGILFLIPGWAWLLGNKNFSYISRYFIPIVGNDDSLAPFAIALAISFSFLLGGIAQRNKIGNYKNFLLPRTTKYSKPLLVLLITLFISTFISVIINSNIKVYEFFIPSLNNLQFKSEYIKKIYLNVPITILVYSIIKEKGFTKKNIILVLFIALLNLGTGQRRDLVSYMLFILFVKIFTDKNFIQKFNRKSKMKISIILGLFGLLSPTLWWLRYYTKLKQSNSISYLKPWEVRSYFEILFGGQGSGFSTFMLIYKWKKSSNVFFYSFKYLSTIFIPRSIWPSKYVHPDVLLQNHFYLETNPSFFLVNEIYFNFGFLSIFVAFLMGVILSRITNSLYRSEKIYDKILLSLLLSNIIMLFKNGFSIFIVNILFSSLIVFLPLKFMFNYQEKKF